MGGMTPFRATVIALLLSLTPLIAAQGGNPISGVTQTTTSAPGETVPFFSATTLPPFTPTATGASPVGGTEVTITESGEGSTGTDPTGIFSFTRPSQSVPPTGGLASVGLGGSVSNLIPDPTNLERAGAQRTAVDRHTFAAALFASLFGIAGAAWVFA